MERIIHNTYRLPALIILAILLLAGCSDEAPTSVDLGSVEPSSAPETAAAQQVPDLTGTWAWSETTVIQVREPYVVPFFGIQPEGPITHVRCDSEGTLSLNQTGSTFNGSGTQSSTCVTQGGQAVPAPFPPTLTLIDGEVRGRSFRFTYDAGPFPTGETIFCPYQGSIRVEGDMAVELKGHGDCLLPNEQEFGHDHVLDFEAARL